MRWNLRIARPGSAFRACPGANRAETGHVRPAARRLPRRGRGTCRPAGAPRRLQAARLQQARIATRLDSCTAKVLACANPPNRSRGGGNSDLPGAFLSPYARVDAMLTSMRVARALQQEWPRIAMSMQCGAHAITFSPRAVFGG